MSSSRLAPGLLAALLAATLMASACATSGSATQVSPRPTASGPRPREVFVAIKRLAPATRLPGYPMKLMGAHVRPAEVGMYAWVSVGKVAQDAQGRWVATAEYTPPLFASSSPGTIVLVKDAAGWRIVSIHTRAFPTMGPGTSAIPQPAE